MGLIKHLLCLALLSIWCLSDQFKHTCYRIPSLSQAEYSIPIEVYGILPDVYGSFHEVIQKLQQEWSQAWYPVNKEQNAVTEVLLHSFFYVDGNKNIHSTAANHDN
jgi:hypothetical protein